MRIKKNANNLHNIIKETGSKDREMVLVLKKLKSIIMKTQIIIFQLISLTAINIKVNLKKINIQAMELLNQYFHIKKKIKLLEEDKRI